MDLKEYIRTIPDFPKPGINFRDITPLLKNHDARQATIAQIKDHYAGKRVDAVAAAEARGFIFGALLAHELKCSFVPLRKAGKLPYKTVRQAFKKEYGEDCFEVHADAISAGESVLVVDDVLATGGTAEAAVKLVERLGGSVTGVAFLMELIDLKGCEKLNGYDVFSLLKYKESEL